MTGVRLSVADLAEAVTCHLESGELYYLILATTICYGLKRFALKVRFMILILTI
jgi:hypothetical protein